MNSQSVNSDEARGEFESEAKVKAEGKAGVEIKGEGLLELLRLRLVLGMGMKKSHLDHEDSSRGFSGVARLANIVS